jgi:hypothetical protein
MGVLGIDWRWEIGWWMVDGVCCVGYGGYLSLIFFW